MASIEELFWDVISLAFTAFIAFEITSQLMSLVGRFYSSEGNT